MAASERRPRPQRCSDRLLIQLVSGVLAAEPGQERRGDRLPRSKEHPDRGGERYGQAGAQLMADRHLSQPGRRPSRTAVRGCGVQRQVDQRKNARASAIAPVVVGVTVVGAAVVGATVVGAAVVGAAVVGAAVVGAAVVGGSRIVVGAVVGVGE